MIRCDNWNRIIEAIDRIMTDVKPSITWNFIA